MLLSLSIIAILEVIRSRLVLDDRGIVYYGGLGKSFEFKWSDIRDVYYSDVVISIATSIHSRRINLSTGRIHTWGCCLEPFDELQAEIQSHVDNRLTENWKQLTFPLTYLHPKMGIIDMAPYLIPLAFIFYVLALLSLTIEGLWLQKIILTLICMLPLIPFAARDYRRSHKSLTLEVAGIRQVNGDEVFIPWDRISDIQIREVGVSSPATIVKGDQSTAIYIPRSLLDYGQILYLVQKNSAPGLISDYELA
jgi:hypothetical protein